MKAVTQITKAYSVQN